MNKFESAPENVEGSKPVEAQETSPQEQWNEQVKVSKEKAKELTSSVAELEGLFSNFPAQESIGIKLVGDRRYELSAPETVDAGSMGRLQDLYNQLSEVIIPAEGENMGRGGGHPLSFSIYNESQHLTPATLFEKINEGLKAAEEFKG